MYIEGFERKEIYGYDKVSACLMYFLFYFYCLLIPEILDVCLKVQEMVLLYWKKTAVGLIYNEANKAQLGRSCLAVLLASSSCTIMSCFSSITNHFVSMVRNIHR